MKINRKYLIISALFISVLSISCKNQDNKKELVSTNQTESPTKMVSKSVQSAKIESGKVCFVNNKFMGIDQIPVEVDAKTYYGCCQGCVDKIKQNLNDVRFTLDPLTGSKVDKALAYIVLDPKGNGNQDVLYFASEQNYLNYIK